MAAFTPTGVEFVARNFGGYLGDLKKADKAQQKLGKSASAIGKQFTGLGQNILKVGAIASTVAVGGISALSAGVIGLGASATNTAISFESAFTGVTKTTDGLLDDTSELTEAGRELRSEFVDLSKEIPKSFEELAAIGEIGGQLGIGREALASFTESIAALGVSTNLAEEEAATALARIANIFQVETRDMGLNTERLGSTIVGLGNNFATTEREIVDFATRIAGAGRIAGFTQADILAFSTAFSSVGVQAEAGGTATQAAILAIEDAVNTGSEKLDIFAQVAGVSSDTFSLAWEKNAAEAFRAFIIGLGREGDNASVILDQLGLDGARSTRAFLSLANAGDLVTRTLDESARFWEENNALSREAANRYGTTESQIQIFRNTLRATADTIGQRLLPFIEKLLEVGTRLIERWAEPLANFVGNQIVPALEALVNVFSRAISEGGGLIEAFEFGGLSGLASRLGITQEITILRDQVTQAFREIGQTITEIWTSIFGDIAGSDILTRINAAIIFIVRNFEAFKGALIGIGAVLAGGVFAAILAGLLALLTPINLIIVAAAALGAAWTTNWMGIQDITFNVIEMVKSFLGDLDLSWSEIWSRIQETTLSTIETIRNVIQVFVDAFQNNILPPIREAFANLTEALNELGLNWGDVWEALKQATIIVGAAIGVAILGIISVVGGLAAGIASAIATATNFIADFQEAWVQTITGITQIIVGFKEFINGVFQLDLPQAIEGLKLLFTGLGNFIPGIFNLITTAISSAIATWTSFFTAFKDTATGIFQGLFDALVGNSIIPDLINEIVALFTSLPELLLGALAGLTETVGSFFTGLFGFGEEGGGPQALVDSIIRLATEVMPILIEQINLFVSTAIAQFSLIIQQIIQIDVLFIQLSTVTIPVLIEQVSILTQLFIESILSIIENVIQLNTRMLELITTTIQFGVSAIEAAVNTKESFSEVNEVFDSLVDTTEELVKQVLRLATAYRAAASAAMSVPRIPGLSGAVTGGATTQPIFSRGRPFQAGTDGIMTVPAGGLTARLHPGEEFAVAPRGESLTNMLSGPIVQINNPVINNGMDAQALGAFVAREVESRFRQ